MDLGQSALILTATILMIAGLALAFVPIMPGPVLMWAIAVIFAVLNGFQRMTPAAVLVVTLLMIAGSASDLWLPLLGIRTGGLTCLSSIGALIGGLVGSFVIPIPLVGTLVGAAAGAVLVELTRRREFKQAVGAGKTAFRNVLLSYIVQLIASFAIFAVYIVSLQTTG